jgi:hypothetical protein
VVLEPGDCISFDGSDWRARTDVLRLSAEGDVLRVSAW